MGKLGKIKNCVGFDCGNSSIRVMLGQYDGNTINMHAVHQVENQEIEVNGLYYWDILNIFKELKTGLQKAYNECEHIDSVGICTWGIDFGLLDSSGHLMGNPLCYRNTLGQQSLSELDEEQKEHVFGKTGILNNRINSLYQLLGLRKNFPERFAASKKCLLIPDLLTYMFTGKMATEVSIASTTQLMNMVKKEYAREILDMFRLDPGMFMPTANHGEIFGFLNDSLAKSLKINKFPFICVPSHDTASAVTAVPSEEKDFLFISSGTWSLIGTELEAPIINKTVYESEFTNEGGVFGSITLLKNSTGMFILQKIKRELKAQGKNYTWDELEQISLKPSEATPLINPNDDDFFNPESMIQAILDYFKRTKQENDGSISTIISSVYKSLSLSYCSTLDQIRNVTGRQYSTIHIIGGGSRNNHLNQLTADFSGKTVLAGPEEAASLGNIGVQLKYFDEKLTLSGIREIVKKSVEIKRFTPGNGLDANEIRNELLKFKALTN